MEETDDSKGTYEIRSPIPSFPVVMSSVPFFVVGYLFPEAYRIILIPLFGLSALFAIWSYERQYLQEEAQLVIAQKFTRVGLKSGVSYYLKPLGWKESLEVDSFVYSLIDTEHVHVIAKYGKLSREITRITIL